MDHKNLEGYLKEYPSISTVYFNDQGEYLFHQRKGFDIAKSREEILQPQQQSTVKKEKIKK